MICALISPTFSLMRSRQSFFPAMIASRASFTHAGQSESVCRGNPSVGLVFSQDLSSGLSDHCGVTDGFGLRLLKCWIVLKVIPAVLRRTQSIDLKICVATRFDINFHPPLLNCCWDSAHSIVRTATKRLPPGSKSTTTTVSFKASQATNPLTSYSL